VTVAEAYLEWLSNRVKGQDLFDLSDCFSAHRDQANEIPAGFTDEWQLFLDPRIFEA
jgi:hypothetical protein